MNLDPLPAISPLSRPRSGQPAFLAPHHLEAALRVQKLFERSQLRTSTTMRYAPRVSTSPGADDGGSVTDMAVDARLRLNRLLGGLPSDCADVVMDICGFEKGLGQIETERQWPRRSAKLILRVGLDALAVQMGLSAMAEGGSAARQRVWRTAGARPAEIG